MSFYIGTVCPHCGKDNGEEGFEHRAIVAERGTCFRDKDGLLNMKTSTEVTILAARAFCRFCDMEVKGVHAKGHETAGETMRITAAHLIR
jgi:hypothetical protein